MHTLFLDLASHRGCIAFVDEKSVLALNPIDHRLGDHEVIPMIDHVLAAAQCKKEKIDRVACVVGPGGFMSLRAGVSLANAMSFVLDLPTCGIHLSDLYFFRSPKPEVRIPKIWLHSTKKSQLFLRRFPEEATCIDLEELSSHVHKGEAWMGELIPEHRAIVDHWGLTPVDILPLEDILPLFLAEQEYRKSRILEPWYGRGW